MAGHLPCTSPPPLWHPCFGVSGIRLCLTITCLKTHLKNLESSPKVMEMCLCMAVSLRLQAFYISFPNKSTYIHYAWLKQPTHIMIDCIFMLQSNPKVILQSGQSTHFSSVTTGLIQYIHKRALGVSGCCWEKKSRNSSHNAFVFCLLFKM